MRRKWRTKQREITEKIYNLMANELVGEPELFMAENLVLADYDCVIKASPLD